MVAGLHEKIKHDSTHAKDLGNIVLLPMYGHNKAVVSALSILQTPNLLQSNITQYCLQHNTNEGKTSVSP